MDSEKLKPLHAETAMASPESWNSELGRWDALIRSGGLPKHIDSPTKAIAIVRTGDVFGWDPMRSLRSIYIVEGMPGLSAEAMLSLIREKCPEAIISPIEMTSTRVRIEVERPPQKPCVIETTAEQFKHLIEDSRRKVWTNYTGDMLWARAITRMARRLFPDIIAGVSTAEELRDIEAAGSVRQVGPRPMDLEDEGEVSDAEIYPSADPVSEGERVEPQPNEIDERIVDGIEGDGPPTPDGTRPWEGPADAEPDDFDDFTEPEQTEWAIDDPGDEGAP